MTNGETGLAEEAARAMRELARTVTDAPPLRLAPRQGARMPRHAWRRRWTLWAVPLAAAAAVIAIAVALVTIRDLPNGRAVPPTTPTSSSAAGVPAYYAEPETVCKTCQSARLVVGDTFTGAKLATFTPPHGTTFLAVSAAADDRTFVADTTEFPFNVETQHVTWYLHKITPGASAPVRLTRLPIPATPSTAWVGTVALSPSGRELAVTYQFRHATLMTTVLRIYSVATGKLLHSWSTDSDVIPGGSADFFPYMQSNNQLSWVDGGRTLSFTTTSYTGPSLAEVVEHVTVRTMSVTAAGSDLVADSHVVWSMRVPLAGPSPTEPVCTGDAALTANGKTVVCDGLSGYPPPGGGNPKARSPWRLLWGEYQLSAPKVARALYQFTAYSTGHDSYSSSVSVQWASASGSTLIIAWSVASVTYPVTHFGVLTDGRFTPLPAPPGSSHTNAPDIAW
jgi:hypothetical protein